MRIVQFTNYKDCVVTLTVEPSDKVFEVPHLATIGIRYSVESDACDRYHSSISETGLEFWCDDENYEVDLVLPSSFDLLLWDMCVKGGWCGGLVNGESTHVSDLLPEQGTVSAEQFARLAIRADGHPDGEPMKEKHLSSLADRFVKHFGQSPVGVEILRGNHVLPFEDGEN